MTHHTLQNTLLALGLLLALAACGGDEEKSSDITTSNGTSETSNGTNGTSNGTSAASNGTTAGGLEGCGDDICDASFETFENCPLDCIERSNCTIDEDCAEICEETTLGCACIDTAMGNTCIPKCNEDADCPEIAGVQATCNMQNICTPGSIEPNATCGDGICGRLEDSESCPQDCMDNMGDRIPCEADSECVESCEYPDLGCVCQTSPMGMSCRQRCETDDQCTDTARQTLICGPNNICSREESTTDDCGNGTCDTNENANNCPEDCSGMTGMCGDGTCGDNENANNCPEDCTMMNNNRVECETEDDCAEANCNDSRLGCACSEVPALDNPICITRCETDEDCPTGGAATLTCDEDSVCRPTVGGACGDGTCNANEDANSCPEDCAMAGTCGDGACGDDEDTASCPEDCAVAGRCGDGTCNANEDAASCPEDCNGMTGMCGNGTCDANEDVASCPEDCSNAEECGDDSCGPTENPNNCPEDCAGAQTCTEEADCADACANHSLGCSCAMTPMGNRCIARCESDADCPTDSPRELTCSGMGLCRPSM